MTIYLQRKDGRPINPGVALYKFWHGCLMAHQDARPQAGHRLRGSTTMGAWRISTTNGGPDHRPNISFGYTFELNHRGDFTLRHQHGAHQRNILASETFLAWSYFRSGYQWYINTTPEGEGKRGATGYERWHGGRQPLGDHSNPRQYIPESLLLCRSSGIPWFKSVWSEEEGRWVIDFAGLGRWPGGSQPVRPEEQAQAQEKFEAHKKLVQRRYRLLATDALRQQGILPPPRRATPLSAEETEKREQEQVSAIVAHLRVEAPARTQGRTTASKSTEEVGA